MKYYKIYRELQKHLNSMPIGFPASVNKNADIRLLKHIFTPEEAKIACFLTDKPETFATIFKKIDIWQNEQQRDDANINIIIKSPEHLATILDKIQKKGGIESKIKDGVRYYCNSPLVIGIYEMQVNRLTPKFLEDFSKYNHDINFGLEFLSLKKPQMRVIPIQKSITPIHRVSHFDEVLTLFEKASSPFVVLDCICRKKSKMEGEPCKVTNRKETCLAVGNAATNSILMGVGREISRNEAISIIEQNQKDGLVLQPSNTEELDFICSCCGCCCGMLSVHQKLPIPIEFWSSNFYVAIDSNRCNGCGICSKRCQVGGISNYSLDEKRLDSRQTTSKKAIVDLNVCIGCGLCVPTCPKKAIALVKKQEETKPPLNREELYDIIMDNKKHGIAALNTLKDTSIQESLNKLKVVGKLARGMLKTGKIELLRNSKSK